MCTTYNRRREERNAKSIDVCLQHVATEEGSTEQDRQFIPHCASNRHQVGQHMQVTLHSCFKVKSADELHWIQVTMLMLWPFLVNLKCLIPGYRKLLHACTYKATHCVVTLFLLGYLVLNASMCVFRGLTQFFNEPKPNFIKKTKFADQR